MGIMGRMRVVVVKIARAIDERLNGKDDHVARREGRFRKPGRIGHHYENGKDFRTIHFDHKDDIEDLLPKPEVAEYLPTELNYILTVNFGSPIPKT